MQSKESSFICIDCDQDHMLDWLEVALAELECHWCGRHRWCRLTKGGRHDR